MRRLIFTMLLLLAAAPRVSAQADLNPQTPEISASCSEGLRLFRERHYAAAAPLLAECLEVSGERLESLLALTVISIQQEQSYDAVKWGRRALDLEPENIDVIYWYGRALLSNDDAPGAMAQWEKGLALDSEHLGILEGLARLHLDMGQDGKAYGLLNQLVRVGGDLGWAHRAMSDISRRRGMWAQALAHWRDSMERDKPTGSDLRTASELAVVAGDTAYALSSAREAVALDPVAASYGALGEALFVASRHQEAERALARGAELNPNSARVQFNLANILEILDRPDEAEPHFLRYTEIAPDDPMGFYNYAVHLDKRGRFDEALVQIEHARLLEPGSVETAMLNARLREKSGNYAGAVAMVDSLLEAGVAGAEDLSRWRGILVRLDAEVNRGAEEGKYHLLHIVLVDPEGVSQLLAEIEAGEDFGNLAVRFSVGPTAVRGGDIGWVAPQDMAGNLREAIEVLGVNEISPPVESGGLTHLFKRIR